MKYTILTLFLATTTFAAPLDVYYGTGGKGAEGIYHSTFDPEDGKFGQVTLAAKIGAPGFLALHPQGYKLYAAARTKDFAGVVGYKVAKDGSLTEFTQQANPDGGGAHIAVHPTGKFLLTAQYRGGATALFPLFNDGTLGKPVVHEHKGGSKVVPERQSSPHPHWCGFSPDGQYALVPDLGMDKIIIYKVDLAKPSITPHSTAESIPGGGPRHMRFSVDGKFIYLLNELALSVTTFSWDATTGTAKKLSVAPALTEEAKAGETFNSAAEILVHPSGKFVYSSNRGHDTVTAYQADPCTGQLQAIQVQPIRGAFPRNINLTPDGQWLLAAGADSNTVSAHRIDPATGKLTYQRGAITNVPSPICIVFAE